MDLEPDILERVTMDFAPADRLFVIEQLSAAERNGHISRCILTAARGSVQRITELIRSAELDTRNAIVAGEFEDFPVRKRDLRVSFLIDSPEDFWVSDAAITAHHYGYRITSIDSQSVSTPPFIGGNTNGTATFSNGRRTFSIWCADHKWTIVFDDLDLCTYGLESPLEKERFRIQLDYLLSRLDAEIG